ncbi:hypothetical protein BAE44_0022513 [Dichanthelium oligosanthes]|uniref:Disease resistance N-terminal domain-containing protein n=1 Tax=Dichanthelium oligosanthes TaxID=888268 RepID=A0A1E5UUH2_9POAL|nr:hypothetical protein BAE44_0022513 [Dichanthelium oligosanthes]
MEAAVSAIAGELLSRLISSITKKYMHRAGRLDKKLERLQHLLLRVHTVVEEAEARCITSPRMLVQLKILVDGLYRGYYMLDTFKFRPEHQLIKTDENHVSNTSSLSFASPVKRFRITTSTANSTIDVHDLESVLENLETIVANMTEFVILLAGCQHIQHGPYGTYIYIDNFMFGRSVEKQQIINILFQDDPPLGAPAVLPIIGGCYVGKKTLVGHVCHAKSVLSHFSSIVHLSADDIQRKNHKLFTHARTLAVIQLFSDVDDDCWAKFYSSTTCMGRGSKVVIISRLESVARFGTMKPIRLNSLSHEEYVYLFKVLSFGSANPENHPQLASIGMEIARMLRGLLLSSNVIAEMLRKNLNVQYWLHILKRFRNTVESNFCEFGEHPKLLVDKEHPVDITRFASSSLRSSLRLMPTRVESRILQKERSNVTFGDLIAGSSSTTVLPKEEFEIVIWKSKLRPYTTFVATCAKQKAQIISSSSKKRRGFDL